MEMSTLKFGVKDVIAFLFIKKIGLNLFYIPQQGYLGA
jgi:hypothetical protein